MTKNEYKAYMHNIRLARRHARTIEKLANDCERFINRENTFYNLSYQCYSLDCIIESFKDRIEK